MPYVLGGDIRTYYQQMLERFEIRSLLLFFCRDDNAPVWRFSDWRGRRQTMPNRALITIAAMPIGIMTFHPMFMSWS